MTPDLLGSPSEACVVFDLPRPFGLGLQPGAPHPSRGASLGRAGMRFIWSTGSETASRRLPPRAPTGSCFHVSVAARWATGEPVNLLRGRSPTCAASSTGRRTRSLPWQLAYHSPPRPSTHVGVLEVPTIGQRRMRMHVRANPPDLDAGFPVTSRVTTVRRFRAGHPLLGFVKYAPPSFLAGESASRSPRLRVDLREKGPPPPRAVLVFSQHLDGFSSPTVQVCSTLLPILGFTTFPVVAKRPSP